MTKSPFAATTKGTFATVDPAGKFLYVCSESSKNISKFQIDQDTGGLPSNTVSATTNLAPAAIAFTK